MNDPLPAGDVLNVAVMAPMWGRDLSYITNVDPRVRAQAVNGAAGQGDKDDETDEAEENLAHADVVLVGFPVPLVLAARAPRMRWAHHTQAGVSNLLGSDLWTSSVTLTSSRGFVAATAIAEYVLAAASHFARGLHEASRQKHEGVFTREGYQMSSLTGATMAVVGLGGIGQEVARLSRAAGMRVIGTRRSVTVAQTNVDGADVVLPADRILDVAAEADYLAICSQLTPETQGMVNSAVFAVMKPSAVLINIARGEEVDEPALVSAIRDGRIRGAVLDVYENESTQPPRPELLELPQILLTPHISGRGDDTTIEVAKRFFAENLRRFLDGHELLNLVDRERGY